MTIIHLPRSYANRLRIYIAIGLAVIAVLLVAISWATGHEAAAFAIAFSAPSVLCIPFLGGRAVEALGGEGSSPCGSVQ